MHQPPLGAVLGEFAGERQRRPQVVARRARRQEHHVAVLGDLVGEFVGEAARVDDDDAGAILDLAQLLQALEGAGVDVGLDRVLQPDRVPLDAGELLEIEIGEQRLQAAMRRADREQPRQRALADAALLADETDGQRPAAVRRGLSRTAA